MTIQTNGDDCRESGAGETSREQFEAYYLSEHPRRFTGKNTIEDIRAVRCGDSYWAEGNSQFSDIAVQWKAWQASRAAINIELPECADAEDKEEMLEMCRQSVHYAGLKNKGEP